MNYCRICLQVALVMTLISRADAQIAGLDYLDRYNVVWTTPSKNSSESMPLGGGQIGANVWVENGDLLVYAQQSGAFDKNGEYIKLGRFRLKLSPNPFADGGTFRQELKLKEGFVQVTADHPASGKVAINLWIEVKRPILHIDIQSDKEIGLTTSYESWRFKDVVLAPEERPATGRRSSIFDYDGYQVGIVKKGDTIEPARNQIVWFQNNAGEFNAFQFALKNEGIESHEKEMWDPLKNLISGGLLKLPAGIEFAGTTDGTYFQTPFRAWNFKSVSPAKTYRLEIVGQVARSESADAWKAKLAELAGENPNLEKIWADNLAWWSEFWNRTYVQISPDKDASDNAWRVARNYTLFRYQLGGNTYGTAPTKFNGGNLTFDAGHVTEDYQFDPDYRRWGGWSYTAANQQLVYWAYLKNGDFDAMIPQFEVYRNGLVNAEARTRAHWGHDGCSFAEQFQHSGMPVTSHYGFLENGFSFFIRPKDFEKGEMSNPWISTYYAGQLDFALMILEYQRFTGRDISAYMPFILSCIRFYDEHYQMIHKRIAGQPLDERGRLAIFPSTHSEHHLNSTNPSDAITALTALTRALLDQTTLEPGQRSYIVEFQKRIPDPPTYKQDVDGKERTFFKISDKDGGDNTSRSASLSAIFPVNSIYPGSEHFDWQLDTWKYKVPLTTKQAFIGWQRGVIHSARLGLTDEAQFTLLRKLDDSSSNRFPSFWGPGYDWSPDHNWGGSGMIGLEDMLLQTPGREIRLLPAWPKNWDVSFKLHAPYNTTVQVRYVKGAIEELKVSPESRAKDVVYPPKS